MTSKVEWPTLGLLLLAYLTWGAAVFWLSAWGVIPAILIAGIAMTLHSSLQHEAIHGHPFRNEMLNALFVWPPLTLFVPYLRFRDTHLAHHLDCELTDPYDDPESNFLDPRVWDKLPGAARCLLTFNNTLVGRLLFGALIGTIYFLWSEWRSRQDARVVRGWLWHIPATGVVLGLVATSPMPLWAYLVASYVALSLLRIRTFLEHRAHEHARARTVIIEDRGPLALLFLNNNLHAVHHMHPGVAWYDLPKLLREKRDRFLEANEGYLYRSYGEVFRRYFFRAKDPVAHPLWRGK